MPQSSIVQKSLLPNLYLWGRPIPPILAGVVLILCVCICMPVVAISSIISLPTVTSTPNPTKTLTSTPLPTDTATSSYTPTTTPTILRQTMTNTPRIVVSMTATKNAATVAATSKPLQPTVTKPPTNSCPQGCITQLPGCSIKGNVNVSTEEKIYHMPGQRDYDKTEIDPSKGERWFCTENEARANGWRKAQQ